MIFNNAQIKSIYKISIDKVPYATYKIIEG